MSAITKSAIRRSLPNGLEVIGALNYSLNGRIAACSSTLILELPRFSDAEIPHCPGRCGGLKTARRSDREKGPEFFRAESISFSPYLQCGMAQSAICLVSRPDRFSPKPVGFFYWSVFNKTVKVQPTSFANGSSVCPVGDEARIRPPARWATAMCCKRGTPGLAIAVLL
jgi:hypothetical protein